LVRWDLPVKHVAVDDIKVGYSEIGDGPPILMIMGLWGTMDLWDPNFVKALAKDRRVIMFDNRGMGSTTAGSKEFSVQTFASDVVGIIKALNLKRADVLGWAMGGSVALVLAENYPDVVRHLVIYAGSCGGKECTPTSPEIQKMYAKEDLTMEDVVRSMFPKEWNEAHPDIWEYYPEARTNTAQANLERQLAAEEEWTGCFDDLKFIRSASLIVNGDEDLDCPKENAIILNLEIAGSKMVLFHNAGHGLMYQMPLELAEAIHQFLGGVVTQKE